MCNISTSLDTAGTIKALTSLIDEVLETNPKALTLLISAGNAFTKDTLDPLLKSLPIPVSGGIFKKVIFKESLLDLGSVVVAWHNDVKITNYKNIEHTDSIKDLVGSSSQPQTTKDIGEYLIFIDGVVSSLEENLDVLYRKIGFRATFAGGGAGTRSLGSSPCIVSNEGLLKNAMQTVATNYVSRITTTHGWQKQSGPHLVTSADRTKIKTLNYEPIASFYKKYNNKNGNNELKDNSFSSFYRRYPIGIEKLGGDLLVREPINYEGGFIEYVGNIPEYSKVHILSGTVDSSRNEVDKELEQLQLKREKNVDATFIFSCGHRDDADSNGESKELKMLNQHLSNSKHIVGALSFGEIATGDSRLLELHSKTIVISRLMGS